MPEAEDDLDQLQRDYLALGIGERQGMPSRPALVIVDMMRGFTRAESPFHCDADEAVTATQRLLAAARRYECPVAFTRVEYDQASSRAAKTLLEKMPALRELTAESGWTHIDERVGPRPDELVIVKLFPSAFFGTVLKSFLVGHGCDAVVCVGTSTSGCVRATVVDSVQNGFRVFVPREAVADRAAIPHEAAIFDIDTKYGDVISTATAIQLLRVSRWSRTTPTSLGEGGEGWS